MVALANPFSQSERDLWAPPEQLTTTEWADAYRILSEKVARQAGRYKSSRVPYARGVMDALSDDKHREVYLMKPVQSGGSELGRNWLGRSVDLDPGPIMIVFPSQESCKENVEERITPMFSDTPRLKRLLTGRKYDVKKGAIHLRSCSIYTGWSGSPQALASRPIRYLFLDEIDKYAGWRGVEADPLSLAKDRTLTYGHLRKIYGVSTPTTPSGPIAKAVNACGDVRDYWVRCVKCHELNLPNFERVSWKGKKTDTDEDQLRLRKRQLESGEILATYSCEHCDAELTQENWWFGVELGEWVSVGCEPGEHPESETVGFRLSGLCSPWIGVQIAAKEFVSATLEGMGALQNFYNGFLGVPFWSAGTHGDTSLQVTQQKVWSLASSGGARLQCPEWTQGVVSGVDSGKVEHQYVIRAYGEGYRSQLLDYGVAANGDELLKVLDRRFHGPGGRLWDIEAACIDVGGSRHGGDMSRTEEILKLCEKDLGRLIPIKGQGERARRPIAKGERMTMLDVNYWKDVTASQINSEIWHPFHGVSRDYVLQVASEKKVLVQTKINRDGTTEEVWRWVVHFAGKANHFWDCENYATVAAHIRKLGDVIVDVEYDYSAGAEDDDEPDSGWRPVGDFWRRGKW